jgi:hypothetical protein
VVVPTLYVVDLRRSADAPVFETNLADPVRVIENLLADLVPVCG